MSRIGSEYARYNANVKRKTFGAPGRYVQGPGVLREVTGKVVEALGKRAFIFGGKRSFEQAKEAGIIESLEEEKVEYHEEALGKKPWGPECCESEINRLVEIGKEKKCDMVIGCGGGKPMDTAKAVADKMDVPVIIVPTIASCDAPCSALSVIYTEEHVFKEYRFYSRNPNIVLVDTEVIAKSPPRLLACGIGDAMGKYSEVPTCVRSGADNCLPKPIAGHTTLFIAKGLDIMIDTLFEYGVAAMDSLTGKVPTPALEAVVEACILHSGLVFESGGLAAAHSIYDGFTALEAMMDPYQYHGEGVFMGLLAESVLDGYPKEEIYKLMKFGHEVGLPITLEEFGLAKAEDEDLKNVAERACAPAETIHNTFFKVTPDMVFNAIKLADELGKSVAEEVPRRPYKMVLPRIKIK